MTKVSLRVYIHEIENMVEAGQLNEAITHCQHILKTFPMHVETYLLLGKAFLEARRYSDASDIFQRVLMVVPDNFVSHVGMSIIRDDEGKLDDAIWHMERAFEVQPSNPAIQGELRRLYGRRDGVEPPKIRLSRDALANMYAQGELFNQAIAEIRAVLADDENRADLQVMLARAYYRGGRKVEAVEMAANLLKKYTYCMDALKILVDMLPGTTRAEDTQVYRQRLRMLDPYTAFVTGSVFEAEKVDDGAVSLERLDYRPGAAPATSQPGWAASLGIQLESDKNVEPVPTWMNTSIPSDQSQLENSEPASEGEALSDEETSVPEWMRSAGWHESGQAESGEAGEGGMETPEEPIAEADIPDWLKAMAPPETPEGLEENKSPFSGVSEAEPSTGSDVPDWLSDLKDSGTESTPEPSQTEPPVAENAFPDWLTDEDAKEQGELVDNESAFSPEIPAENVREGDSSPLQQSPIEIPGFEMSATEESANSWSGSQSGSQDEIQQPEELSESIEATSTPSELEETKPISISADATEEVPIQPTGEARPLNIEDDTLAWLESLAMKQGAKEEELLSKPEDRIEGTPDLVQTGGEFPSVHVSEPPEPGIEGEGALPSHPSDESQTRDFMESQPQEHIEPSAEKTTIPSDLSYEQEQPSEKETLPTSATPDVVSESATPEENIPDWLGQLNESEPAEEETPPSPSGPIETPPAWLETPIQAPDTSMAASIEEMNESEASAEVESMMPDASQSDEENDITITNWLSKMDVEEELKKTQAISASESPSKETSAEPLPDWLKELDKTSTQAEDHPVPESFAIPGDLPEWLRKPVDTENEVPSQPISEQSTVSGEEEPGLLPLSETLPEQEPVYWGDEGAAVSDLPSPTTPEEWVPVEQNQAPPQDNIPESIEEKETTPDVAAAPPAEVKHTGTLARVPVNKDADLLKAAQADLEADKLNDAMKTYSALIKKGHLLDEVIHDLHEALYRFPVDVIVWQTLGDASMRANRLQDALDAYTKAEELLR
jgi:tetratricopeptide (TPR) repeat protein